MKCGSGFYPVAVYQDVAHLNYTIVIWVLWNSYRMGMTLEAFSRSKETEHFRGILTENYVAIVLENEWL